MDHECWFIGSTSSDNICRPSAHFFSPGFLTESATVDLWCVDPEQASYTYTFLMLFPLPQGLSLHWWRSARFAHKIWTHLSCSLMLELLWNFWVWNFDFHMGDHSEQCAHAQQRGRTRDKPGPFFLHLSCPFFGFFWIVYASVFKGLRCCHHKLLIMFYSQIVLSCIHQHLDVLKLLF